MEERHVIYVKFYIFTVNFGEKINFVSMLQINSENYENCRKFWEGLLLHYLILLIGLQQGVQRGPKR